MFPLGTEPSTSAPARGITNVLTTDQVGNVTLIVLSYEFSELALFNFNTVQGTVQVC